MSELTPSGDPRPTRFTRPSTYVLPEQPPAADAAAQGHGLTLRDAVTVLRRRLWLVILPPLLTGSIAAYMVHTEQPRWQASAVIRLDESNRSVPSGLDVLDRRAVDNLASQLQLLRSSAVLGKVVDRERLHIRSLTPGFDIEELRDLEFAADLAGDTLEFRFAPEQFTLSGRSGEVAASYGDPLETEGVRFSILSRPAVDRAVVVLGDRERWIRSLRSRLSTRVRGGTDIVDVEYTASDPEVAKRIVNTVVEVFKDHNASQAREDSRRRRTFLEEQLTTTDSILAKSQRALNDFRRREGVFSPREWFAAQQSGLMTLEMRREELIASRRMYHSLLDGVRGAEPGETGARLQALVATSEIAGNPVVSGLHSQVVGHETAREALLSGPWGRSPDHPEIVALEQQIVSLRGRIENAVANHLESLDARIAALDNLRAGTLAKISQLPEAEAEEAWLVQEVQTVRQMADRLRDEHQKARIAEAVEGGQVQVVDLASLPRSPIRTRKTRKLGLGIVLGLMLGGGGAFLLESMNTSFRRREEVEAALHVPGLAVVPQIASGVPLARRLRWLPRRKALGPNGNTPRTFGNRSLVAVTDARGAEAFRTLRTNLIFSQSVQDLNTLVVTSAGPGEGKTTTAANLALAYAQQGMRVLLVDADIRRPRLHGVFGVDRKPGLTQLMLGQVGWEAAVRTTGVDGLSLLPAGTSPPNAPELLGGNRMVAILAEAEERFDLVILDSPPVLAAADALVLATMADGVLMVVRAGQTDRDAAIQAAGQLQGVGARVVGAVLNDPAGELDRYSGYYSYAYEYARRTSG